MDYGVGLAFSGAMSRLKVEQWIRSMEEHMKINKVGSEDMVPYAIKYLVEEAATWWRMHQAMTNHEGRLLGRNLQGFFWDPASSPRRKGR